MSSRKKTVAISVWGVINFLGSRRWLRVVVVARSALSQCGVAAEQANPPDAREARLSCALRVGAGDWRRYAAR